MEQLSVRGSRYVIPFRFGSEERSKRDYIQFLDRKTDRFHGRWSEDSVIEGEQDLYGYVLNSFDDRGMFQPGNIGAAFRYHVEGQEADQPLVSLQYHAGERGGGKVFDLDITEAGLMLFVSGVGFFWYGISALRGQDGAEPDLEEDIQFQSRFKELNDRQNIEVFTLRGDDRPFTTGDWIAEVVGSACPGATFFAERRNVLSEDDSFIVPDKALLFQYAAYSEEVMDAAGLQKAAYHLTKGYGGKYRKPADLTDAMRQPFENVLWYAAKEGVGYYARAGASDIPFFSDRMKRNFFRDYFILYMLALHEQFTMIRFAERMEQELPADPQAYLPPDLYLDVSGTAQSSAAEILDLERTVTRLSTEIHVFFAKNARSAVSFIDHQDRFYHYLLENLRVREDTERIIRGLRSLQMLLQDVVRQGALAGSETVVEDWKKERAYQKLEQEKEILIDELYHDATTGLYNKNGLLHYGRLLYSDAREQGRVLFVCVADMNGLKYVNDHFGHEEGDKALRAIGKVLTECVREGDYAFRQGGDEFLVLGIRDPGSDEEQAFADRMEAAMARYNEENRDERYRLGISYGPLLADMRTCTDTLETLLAVSDERMYDMKMKKDEYRRD